MVAGSHLPHGTVFVADDDDDLRAIIVDALRADGYTVVEARDGLELLMLIEDTLGTPEARPDLVIADVRMPHLSGLGVLDHLKRAHVNLPVVLMTGFAQGSVEVVAKRLGALGVLTKPFDVDVLRKAVLRAKGEDDK